MTTETAVDQRRATRGVRRRRVIIVATIAAVALAAAIVAGIVVTKHAAAEQSHTPFHAENTEQQIGYDVAYREVTQEVQEGRSLDFISDTCRMTAAMSSSTDMTIGTLGGCADALYDVGGN